MGQPDYEAPEIREEEACDALLLPEAAARIREAEERVFVLGSSEGLNIKPDGFFARRLAGGGTNTGSGA